MSNYCQEQILTKLDAQYHKYLTELYKTGIIRYYSESDLSTDYYNFNYYDKLFVEDGNSNLYMLLTWESSNDYENLIEEYIGPIKELVILENHIINGELDIFSRNNDILNNINKIDFNKEYKHYLTLIGDKWISEEIEQERDGDITVKVIKKTGYDFGIIKFSFKNEKDYDKFVALYIIKSLSYIDLELNL